MTRYLYPGSGEAVKREWHRALLVLAGGACLYNGAAFLARREWHLALGALGYAGLIVVEVYQVTRHTDHGPVV